MDVWGDDDNTSNPTETAANNLLEGAPTGAPFISGNGKRKRGRPKGSKNRPKDDNGEPIDIKPEDVKEKDFKYSKDETTEKAAGKLISMLWYVASPFIKARPLNEEETIALGEVAAPLIQKYVPMYEDWKHEINFAVVLIGVYEIARRDYEKQQKQKEKENE